MIAEGKIGKLGSIRAGFHALSNDPDNWRRKKECGGGVVFDFSCYCVNALGAFASGLPSRVYAVWKRTSDGLIEELYGLLEYPNGVIAHLESSYDLSFRQPLELHGDKGTLYIEHAWTSGPAQHMEYRGIDWYAEPERIPVPPANPYEAQLLYLCECMRTGAVPRFTVEESVRNHAVIDALLESAETGCGVVPKLP